MVLGEERGAAAIIETGAFLLCLGVACWIKGNFVTIENSPAARGVALAVMLAVAGAGFALFIPGKAVAAPKAAADSAAAGALSFPEQLEKSRRSGKPVFVDFTANWCINCKYNEHFVLDSDAVKDAFAKSGVILLKADWTNGDPEITKVLQGFGRAGVPVYAFYAPGSASPVILPEILTQQAVLDNLK